MTAPVALSTRRDALLTPGQDAELRGLWGQLERIRRAHFYLLRNDGQTTGERYRCGRCSTPLGPVYHDFYTLLCIPQPFDGETARAYVTFAATRKADGLRWAPSELFDLASRHPRTARQLMAEQGVSDEDVFGLLLGVAEPIGRARAESLAAAINAAGHARTFGHRFTLSGLTGPFTSGGR